MVGKRFKSLVVTSEGPVNSRKLRRWHCQCDCGKTALVVEKQLLLGSTTSCGCYRKQFRQIHGLHKHPLYGIWQAMLRRCRNPRATMWHRYGGRGIAVCERWQTFPPFLADMGEKPSPAHTLERIDNDGDYTPDNVRWATRLEQQQNLQHAYRITARGRTASLHSWHRETGTPLIVLRERWLSGVRGEALFEPTAGKAEVVEVGGRRQTLKAWSAETGIKVNTIRFRLRHGWPPELAVSRAACPDPRPNQGRKGVELSAVASSASPC